MEKRQTSINNSFQFAAEGIIQAVKDNRNLKIHIIVAVLVLLASYYFRVTREEFLIILVMIVLVIAAEMINTSIEEMVDLITTEHRLQAKAAKDVAAGMVLVVSIGAALVGLYIFIPYIQTLI